MESMPLVNAALTTCGQGLDSSAINQTKGAGIEPPPLLPNKLPSLIGNQQKPCIRAQHPSIGQSENDPWME